MIDAQTLVRSVPGVVLCSLVGGVAMVVSLAVGLPVMIVALLIGLGLSSISTRSVLHDGICWCSRSLLYIGVALLGLRIDLADLAQAGVAAAAIVILVLISTIAFGYLTARLLGEDKQFGILMGGAVAICGASAAAAICAAMPDCKARDRQLAITIAGITVLSALAMLLYPIIAHSLDFTAAESGLFLGGAIHNVSQAVGAGYSISNEAGDVTVIFKLLRVSTLLPIVFLISFLSSSTAKNEAVGSGRTILAYFPPFLIVFLLLAAASCFSLIPTEIAEAGNQTAKWALIISLVAIGLKTDVRDVLVHGKKPLLAMTMTTIFMACALVCSIYLFRLG